MRLLIDLTMQIDVFKQVLSPVYACQFWSDSWRDFAYKTCPGFAKGCDEALSVRGRVRRVLYAKLHEKSHWKTHAQNRSFGWLRTNVFPCHSLYLRRNRDCVRKNLAISTSWSRDSEVLQITGIEIAVFQLCAFLTFFHLIFRTFQRIGPPKKPCRPCRLTSSDNESSSGRCHFDQKSR